jgi:hypothetical protein
VAEQAGLQELPPTAVAQAQRRNLPQAQGWAILNLLARPGSKGLVALARLI